MPNHPPIQPLPQTTGRFRHYSGGEYEVLYIARHSETLEEFVVYRQLDKNTGYWARPYSMFFEEIVYNDVRQPRFSRIE